MFRKSLFFATSALVLSACQPAAEAPQDTVVAETPPVAGDELEAADVTEAVSEIAVEDDASSEPAVAVEEEAHEDHDHEDDAHDHETHDDAEDHHDHEEHGHDHHDHHDHHDGHGSFTIEYHFACENIQQLEQLETKWFEKFEQTNKASVNILTDRVQGGATLDASNTRLGL